MKFQKRKLKEIAKKYKIADIYLFGSRVLGFERKESDFDIAVRFKGNLPRPEKIGKIKELPIFTGTINFSSTSILKEY
jgi:predicted nucleotidyltransferase